MIPIQTIKDLESLENRMYEVNAEISLRFIGLRQTPTQIDMNGLNSLIAQWIREVRKIKAMIEVTDGNNS